MIFFKSIMCINMSFACYENFTNRTQGQRPLSDLCSFAFVASLRTNKGREADLGESDPSRSDRERKARLFNLTMLWALFVIYVYMNCIRRL